jgi:hypothetical protein
MAYTEKYKELSGIFKVKVRKIFLNTKEKDIILLITNN